MGREIATRYNVVGRPIFRIIDGANGDQDLGPTRLGSLSENLIWCLFGSAKLMFSREKPGTCTLPPLSRSLALPVFALTLW